jgi:chorismate-pyruvate lyase
MLTPLSQFYDDHDLNMPELRQVDGADMPEPYRQLLVHKGDMTPTLAAFHDSEIHLRLLRKKQRNGAYCRLVALLLDSDGAPVECGAISIYLDRFPEAAREAIRGDHQPLGGILAQYEVPHTSDPALFFEVDSDALINDALGLTGSHTLYGRRNTLALPDGRALADIIEILPPAKQS